MPRRSDLRPVFLCCLLLLSSASQLHAQTGAPSFNAQPHNKHVRATIENLEEQWRTATLSGDAATLDHLLSDDYIGITWTGQVNTKTMQLDRIRNRTLVVHSMELSDRKVKVVQSVAIVTCKATIDSITDGKDTSGEFRYTRVYLRQPSGAWKITNSEATRIPQQGAPGHRRGAPPAATPPAL